jgi:hypothetical protein
MRLFAALLLVLVVVPEARAKGIDSATVCGASGCVALDEPPQALLDWAGTAPRTPPPPGPFYRVTFHVSPGDPGWRVWYVPPVDGSSAFAGNAGERELHPLDVVARAAFAATTRDIDPYPAPVVVAALVDGRPVDDPASYLSLRGRPDELDAPASAEDWITIELRSRIASPWTEGVGLLLSPSKAVLQDGFSFSRLDRATVERILARRGLGSVAQPSEPTSAAGGTSVPVLAGAVAVAAVLGGIGLALHRRRGPRRLPHGRETGG